MTSCFQLFSFDCRLLFLYGLTASRKQLIFWGVCVVASAIPLLASRPSTARPLLKSAVSCLRLSQQKDAALDDRACAMRSGHGSWCHLHYEHVGRALRNSLAGHGLRHKRGEDGVRLIDNDVYNTQSYIAADLV